MTERHELDIRKVLTDYHARELPDATMLLRIDELQKLISRMGEINLMAIEEFEEKNGRFQYMAGQRADLEDALSQLERAIRQMNKQSREMFKEAFVSINERFKRIYPEMFRGGKAELKLTDPDNILESGVDIIAQPPGKRLGSLELMSGGEKAKALPTTRVRRPAAIAAPMRALAVAISGVRVVALSLTISMAQSRPLPRALSTCGNSVRAARPSSRSAIVISTQTR